MSIRPDEITSVLKKAIENFDVDLTMDEVGTVLEVGDGIARVYGLERAMANEMLQFENGAYGMAFNLEEDSVGVVILGDYLPIQEGQTVKRTGRVLSVPAGAGLIGRVVNPLGEPIDGKGPIKTVATMPLEGQAPGIADRQSVFEPLMTGIKAVDAMIPVGRGQRELIIGDRETGKTSVAIDTIINQRGKGVICVYVAVGQKASTVANVVERLREFGAMDYTIVVAATANDPAPMQYIAPYAGTAMAEYFMYHPLQGGRRTATPRSDADGNFIRGEFEHLDEELDHLDRPEAEAEAEPARPRTHCVSTTTSPSRPSPTASSRSSCAARRAARRTPATSSTATAVCSSAPPSSPTQKRRRLADGAARSSRRRQGDVSAYIPTNVISITDGQIYLEPDLFYAGVRPAINVGISVSRVGGNAQTKSMKKVAGQLRLDLAQYRELEAFAQFASDLDQPTRRTSARPR